MADFTVHPLGPVNAYGIPADFETRPIAPEPDPSPRIHQSRRHHCSGCTAIGEGTIQPPRWQWFGSRLLCATCSNARMLEEYFHMLHDAYPVAL